MPLLVLLLAILTMFSFGFMFSPILFILALASAIYFSKKGKYVFASVVTAIVSIMVLIGMSGMALVIFVGK